jgi:hypothetical protein
MRGQNFEGASATSSALVVSHAPSPNTEHQPTRVSLQITKSDLRSPAGARGAKPAEDFDFAPGPPTPTGPPAKDGRPVSSKTLSALEEGVGAVPSKGAVAPSGIKAGEVVVVGGAASRPQSPRKKDKEGSGLNSPKWWGKKVGFPHLLLVIGYLFLIGLH